jgi:hypothetical protein
VDVREISPRQAREVVEREHYLHRKPTVSFAFGLFVASDLAGVCVFGTPASRHLQMGALPSDPGRVTELNRLWVHDRMPRNTESWFVSRCLSRLPSRLVVSYADTSWGHSGTVYRALNFYYAGWTDMERKTPRYDYVPLAEGAHSREAFRSGYKTRIRRRPKVKYWTVTGNKREKRALKKLSGWPVLKWSEEPAPSEHRQRLSNESA